MSYVRPNRHAFVIQLWIEPRETEGAPEEWRGIIEHTTSGQRKAVFTPDDITHFINRYVAFIGHPQAPQDSLKERLIRQGGEADAQPGDVAQSDADE